jgi:hypothetical protein
MRRSPTDKHKAQASATQGLQRSVTLDCGVTTVHGSQDGVLQQTGLGNDVLLGGMLALKAIGLVL